MAVPDSSNEETGRTTPLSWIQERKRIIDELLSSGNETTPQEISIYTEFYNKSDENGATDQAKEFADIIEGVQECSAKLQRFRRHATQAMTNYGSRLDGFEKDDADTTRKMKEDIKNDS